MRVRSLIAAMTVMGVTAAASCGDRPLKNEFAVAGVIRGTLLYVGPPPCTENGKIVGTANILIFDTRLLPPPDGLGTRSSRFVAIDSNVLFRDLIPTLHFEPGGKKYCTPPGVPNVTASSSFEIGPIDPATYQLRGFFDRDGDFHPAFRFANLPTLGDVGGGFISNATAALAGAPAQYTQVAIGEPTPSASIDDADGDSESLRSAKAELRARCQKYPCVGCEATRLCIPQTGFLRQNVNVALALTLPTQRPYFHVAQVRGPKTTLTGEEPAPIANPTRIVLPVDFKVLNANPLSAQAYLYTLDLGADLGSAEEAKAAVASPFFMHLGNPGKLLTASFDANRDGKFDQEDHVVGSTARTLWPLVTFTKLDPNDPIRRTGQDKPRVISSGVTAYDGKLGTLLAKVVEKPEAFDTISGVIRPSAICIPDGSDAGGNTTIVTPFAKDENNADIINEENTITDVSIQLRRKRDAIEVVYACLPPGEMAMNLIYPLTGQAWTIPNESGVCMPGEKDVSSTQCGTRTKLVSQSAVLEFGAPSNAATCREKYDALKATPKKLAAYQACFTAVERKKLEDGTIWDKK